MASPSCRNSQVCTTSFSFAATFLPACYEPAIYIQIYTINKLQHFKGATQRYEIARDAIWPPRNIQIKPSTNQESTMCYNICITLQDIDQDMVDSSSSPNNKRRQPIIHQSIQQKKTRSETQADQVKHAN